jgi:transcriptional regulator with PAS, ATPase and Fis domain
MSVEGILGHLAEIVTEKGSDLYNIKLKRAGYEREFRPPQSPFEGDVRALEVNVEGGTTRLVLTLKGCLDSYALHEVEDVLLMAAQRIELLQGRRLWVEQKENQSAPLIADMIGDSPPMQMLKQRVLMAARCNSTVLIDGESGTGKEVAARAIHRLGPRASGPFIAVNCGAFTESLLESELFGYVKGAFTGAAGNHKGLFEAAHRGTIFLDEIGETAPATQLRLLRVLQGHKVRPVGAHEERTIDVRVIAATNRDLTREVEQKRFRHDLYYRLHVLSIHIPSLRQRPLDILPLTQYFLRVMRERLGFAHSVEIEEDAMHALSNYRWPGNVRELESMLERMAAEAEDGGCITVEQVRRETSMSQMAAGGEIEYIGVLRAGESLADHFRRQELVLYEMVRAQMGGNHSKAARWLGMDRTALYRRVDRARQRTNNWPST